MEHGDTGLDGIDAVYVINLDRATERMADMARQCERLGIHFKRVPAIDGRKLSKRVVRNVTTPFCRYFCSPGMIGCALSHMQVWKAVLRAGYERVLVLEDDAELVSDFKERLNQAVRDVPQDFDVLLGGCVFLCQRDRKYNAMHQMVRRIMPVKVRDDKRTWGSVYVPQFFGGTHCYVVSSVGCRKLFKAIPQVQYHVDICMNHPSMNLYAVHPDLAYQKDMSDSSIASFSFPKSLNAALDTIRDPKRISMMYYINTPYAQVLGRDVNVWVAIFLGLGLLRSLAAPFVVGVFLGEFLIGADISTAACAYVLGWALAALAAQGMSRMAA